MPPWGDASPPLQGQPAYAVGAIVAGTIDNILGSVVAAGANNFSVVWDDGGTEAMIYPHDTVMVRKAWPWE